MAIEVPPGAVGARAAQVLGIAVHEIATRSAKFGALGSVVGRVDVTSAPKGEGDQSVLVFIWREGGQPVQPPKRQGFGTSLIKEIVATSLQADVALDFDQKGRSVR